MDSVFYISVLCGYFRKCFKSMEVKSNIALYTLIFLLHVYDSY